MRVTQLDIARISGVSQATVSRVLSGDMRVEPTIRNRVVAVMKEQNYNPDVRARSLRQRRNNLIGLVLRREIGTLQGDPFFAQLVAEIVDCLIGTPYHLCVDIATSKDQQRFVYDELLRTRRVDGLILVESEPSDERIQRLQDDKFPFVVLGNAQDSPELNAVDNDNVLAGRLAARHLVESGYERVAMVAGPEQLTVTRDRVAGYEQAMVNNGRESIVVYSDFGQQAACDAALQLLRSENRPDAVVAMDDYMAMGVYLAARRLKLSVPTQLGIVGFNDSPLCEMIEGGLTSLNLRMDRLVRFAIQRLLNEIEQKDHEGDRQRMMPCELRVRGSSVRQEVATLL